MRDAAGFTLLETLVAVLVLGFVVGGLAQGLRSGLAGWDRQIRITDSDADLDATSRALRTIIAGMAPGTDPKAPVIAGTPGRLAFIADLPEGAPADPVRLAEMVLEMDGAHRIVLRWTPHLHAKLLDRPAIHETTVLQGVEALRFAYSGAVAGGRPGAWVDRWQGIDPPMLVRVQIRFADAAQHWPGLIIAPMRRRDDD